MAVAVLRTGSNPLILSELQDDFDEDGEVELPPKMTSELNAVFKSAVVSDELMYSTIQREERMGYLPCPQTAIAIAALELSRTSPRTFRVWRSRCRIRASFRPLSVARCRN